MSSSSSASLPVPGATFRLVRLCLATFVACLTITLVLPVLPVHVRHVLGFGDVVVGGIVGLQFVSTVLTRGYAGRIGDLSGPARAMRLGLWLLAGSGLAYVAASLQAGSALAWLALGRVLAGAGESLAITSMLAWGIATVGGARAGQVMTWVGMAIYSALAAGAPLGVALSARTGFIGVAIVSALLPLLAFALVAGVPATTPFAGVRPPLREVLARIAWPAVALALQGIGFAAIGAFAVLYFQSRGWQGAGWLLTAFGVGFVLVRLTLARLPDRFGGARVAAVSMLVEGIGLALLAGADAPTTGLVGAALAGMGCSLVFPALGVVVVQRVQPQVRATALGGYAAFQDIAYALTGPLAGLIAAGLGYSAVFAMAACAAVAGAGVAMALLIAARRG